ncbi:MAG: hypothetical protein EPN37_11520 [Chitinophagaceae bacterium]|nr:MAG: hypothetical protein EPN37_11520 [Chitinophagaceae bacterium]
MKIELKGIHYSAQLSEETSAFSANLYINGYKVGTASNHGHGGATNYTPFNEKGRQLIKEVEAYCKSLPPEKYTVGGEERQLDMNLELYIDDLLTDHLKKKNLQQFRKKLKKYTTNHIVIGIPDQSFRTLRLKFPIDLLLTHPQGESVLTDIMKEKIIPFLKENEKILNPNIPEKILKNAGLSENQYIPPKTGIQEDERQKNAHRKGESL